MERPPSVVNVEDKEKEVSSEKRRHTLETLRMAVLMGSLAFSAMKAVEQNTGGTAEREQTKVTDQIREEAGEKQGTIHEAVETKRERTQQEFLEQFFDATAFVRGEYKSPRIEDGKIISEATLTTRDGRVYETRAEIDIEASQFAGEDQEVLKEKIKFWKPWHEKEDSSNVNIVSMTAEDGSGFKVRYTVTEEGLEMTTQELGSGGQLTNSKTVLIQERPSR